MHKSSALCRITDKAVYDNKRAVNDKRDKSSYQVRQYIGSREGLTLAAVFTHLLVDWCSGVAP